MKRFTAIQFFFCLLTLCQTFSPTEIKAQCTIPWRTDCIDDVQVCALADINGINCSSLNSMNAPACPTICGAPVNNVLYLPFMSQGGLVTVEMSVSNCSLNNTGLEMAITTNCACSPIICQTSCSGPGVYSMTATLPACKYLFLMVDGCGGDICDFELNCSGPGAMRPELTYFSPIIGKTQLCQGACEENYSVQLNHGCGTVSRKWTLDGIPVGTNNNTVKLDFPEEGIFELCVEVKYALLSLQLSCAQVQQKCQQITVRKNPDRVGAVRYLCPETKPFLWHNQFIYDSDVYHSEFSTSGCCKYDSVVEFVYLDQLDSDIVYHLSCNPKDSFKDPLSGQIFNSCQNMKPVILKKATRQYKCDSMYLLNAAFLDYKLDVSALCKDSLILSAQLRDESDSCILPWLDTDIAFRWYLGSDSLKKTIGTDSFLRITRSDQYCLEMTARSMFGMREYDCSYEFCQKIDLSSYTPDPVCPIGLTGGNPSFDHYTIDVSELPADARRQHWRAVGGNIVSPMDSSSISILWDPATVEGIICYRYENSCFPSEECCITVKLISSGSEVRHSKDLRLVPNPFREGFSVWVDPAVHVRGMYLADQLGRRIWSSNPDQSPFTFPMFVTNEIINPGVYYFCAETNKGLLVQRLMKF